jgi:hypothetical protein
MVSLTITSTATTVLRAMTTTASIFRAYLISGRILFFSTLASDMIQVIPAVLRSHNYALVASRNLVSSAPDIFMSPVRGCLR